VLRHFLAVEDWPDAEIASLLDEAEALAEGRAGEAPALPGKVLALLFLDPSLRTRTSFEVAMAREGGRTVVLEPGRGAWPLETRDGVTMDGDAVEHVREAAAVLGRYAEALAVRAFPRGASWAEAREDAVVRSFARHAGVPVINLESARRHPCQELGDALTLRRKVGRDLSGRRFVLTWAWHPKALPTAVPVSAALAAARQGMDVTIAHPAGYDLDPDDLATIGAVAARAGGRVSVSHDLDDAAAGADVLYAKSWGCLADFGDPAAEGARRAGLRHWIADARRMERTRGGRGLLMHCLPVRRDVEVSSRVLDSPWSAVIDQAENRLHAQRALLRRILGDRPEAR